MTSSTPARRRRIGIACNAETRKLYLSMEDLERLEHLGEVLVEEYDVQGVDWTMTPTVPETEERFAAFVADLDVLLLCHGGPRVTARLLAAAPHLKIVGELEGDRFAGRIDVAAAKAAGVLVVDTTHSSSWPVSEWALALALVGLRQHARFRDVIAGEQMSHADYRTDPPARELTGKRVGMIGFGHIAWRLRELLVPFDVRVVAYDPYAPRELADALRIDFAPLETVMGCDVVICLAPATPTTTGMIGARELALLARDAVFVNVSRGVVVDVEALVAKARQEDAWFGLDAHDPEPIAVDSPLRGLRNVFLSPHIGGMTVEAQPRFFTLMVEELERYYGGAEPRAQITDRVVAGRGGH
jgi:phosphoglycerate dehydrogenase-like enzyme